jgi:hypothetical protein
MQLTKKMIEARRNLEQRIDSIAERLQANSKTKHQALRVRADATTFGCDRVQMRELKAHPRFHCFRDNFVRRAKPTDFLAYGRIARFRCKDNKGRFQIYYKPQWGNLPRYRIEFFPDDRLGLRLEEISSVLELTVRPRLIRLEIAFDFGPSSGVHGGYIRRFSIFGKCRPNSVQVRPNYDAWGSRKSSMFVRSYFKKEIGAHRLELQLNNRFLRKHKIDSVFEFQRLVDLLPTRQIFFGRIDEQRLIGWLRDRLHRSAGDTHRILRTLHVLEGHLSEALSYLRQSEHLTNTRRLLIPLDTNRFVLQALRKWAATWPNAPSTLRTRK